MTGPIVRGRSGFRRRFGGYDTLARARSVEPSATEIEESCVPAVGLDEGRDPLAVGGEDGVGLRPVGQIGQLAGGARRRSASPRGPGRAGRAACGRRGSRLRRRPSRRRRPALAPSCRRGASCRCRRRRWRLRRSRRGCRRSRRRSSAGRNSSTRPVLVSRAQPGAVGAHRVDVVGRAAAGLGHAVHEDDRACRRSRTRLRGRRRGWLVSALVAPPLSADRVEVGRRAVARAPLEEHVPAVRRDRLARSRTPGRW